MATDAGIGAWGRLNVGGKIAVIPVLFVLTITGILYYTVTTIEAQRPTALTIDMKARQRTLAYKYTRDLLLEARGLKTDAEATRAVLKATEDAFLAGGPVIVNIYKDERGTLPPCPDDAPAVRSELVKDQKLMAEFFAAADEFRGTTPDDPSFPARRQKLVEYGTTLDSTVNDTVKAMTRYSESKLNAMARWGMILAVAVALCGGTIAWAVTRGITRPLDRVVGQAKRIAAGDLSGEPLPVASGDQVGQLAAVFNHMLESLRGLASQYLTAAQNLTAAAAEILASVQQQAAGTKEQAATVQEITTTMEEVSQSGAQIAGKAKQVAAAAEATSAASTSGSRAVQETTRGMAAIREQVEEVAENVVGLSEKTQAVGEIIATVNDIAERSNLLALNAAIEAAGAGDHGSRFAVVADEMKNLADQAKDSTVQVRTILGEIQKGINTSVMLTEEAVKRVEAGKQQADLTEQTIRQMAQTTLESVQAFEQIIGAGNQQQIGFEQVAQGMKDIRQAATQTATATTQLEAAANNLTALSRELREAVGRYKL